MIDSRPSLASAEDISNDICKEITVRYACRFMNPPVNEKNLRDILDDDKNAWWVSLDNYKYLIKAISNKNVVEIDDMMYKYFRELWLEIYIMSKELTNEYNEKYNDNENFNNKHLIVGCVFNIFMSLHTMARDRILTTICKERM